MSRTLDTFLRPSLLAVAIALGAPLASTTLIAAEQASSARSYNLPAGPLAATLNQIASQAGITLAIDSSLLAGKTSAPVNGTFEATTALREALQGSGLQLVPGSAGSFTLIEIPQGALALGATTISAQGSYESAWGPVDGYLAQRTASGTKTDTSLAEAPRSISVATRSQMQDRAVQNLDDAVRYMPGVTASSYGSDSRSEWLKVRGFEPTQFLDGLPLPKGSYTMPKLETWDLERVALLRGPASSVYGQTPAGGLLDMVSRRPQDTSSHEVQVQVGSYQRKQISFDSTGPIDDEGRFLYRISGLVRDSNTAIDHNEDKRYNLAPSQPVGVIRVAAEGQREWVPLRWGLVPAWSPGKTTGSDPSCAASAVAPRAASCSPDSWPTPMTIVVDAPRRAATSSSCGEQVCTF